MGIFYLQHFDGEEYYACSSCETHIAKPDDIVSKQFHGQSGRAYLFHEVINIEEGEPQDKILATGKH